MNLWLSVGRELGSLGWTYMDVWDGHSIFKTDNTKQLLSSTGNSAQCGSLDGTEIWGRMDTCICMAEFLRSPPETITRLLIGYTPKQNKKVRKKFRWTSLVVPG